MADMPNKGVPTAKKVGILTFVFKYGLLGWGLGSGLAYVSMEWMRHAPNMGSLLLWAAWFFPSLGMVAGFTMWLLGRLFRKP